MGDLSKTKVQRHMDICKALNWIYEMKNKDYGDSFHETFLEEGFAMARIRLSDKLNRFKTLSRKGEAGEVKDESMKDTLLDLANYAIMTAMEMDIRDENAAKEELSKTVKGLKNVNEQGYFASINTASKGCDLCGGSMIFDFGENAWVCQKCGTRMAITGE